MKLITSDEKDRAYKLAKTCYGFTKLSELTGVSENYLREWSKDRKFSFKTKFCSECGDPISKTQPEEATLCALCNMQQNKIRYRERKKTNSVL